MDRVLERAGDRNDYRNLAYATHYLFPDPVRLQAWGFSGGRQRLRPLAFPAVERSLAPGGPGASSGSPSRFGKRRLAQAGCGQRRDMTPTPSEIKRYWDDKAVQLGVDPSATMKDVILRSAEIEPIASRLQ